MSRLQYEARYKEYPNLVQFTHVEQTLALVLSSRLHQSVECFIAVDGGLKLYTESVNDTTWDDGSGRGKGKGGVKPKTAIVSRFSTPSASQLMLTAGAAFTLSTGATLTFSALRRTNPGNEARYADFRIFSSAATEDEVFDDRYGYQSTELLAQWSQGLGAVTFTLSCGIGARQYARAALTESGEPLAGEPQRRDVRTDLQAGVSIPILTAGAGGIGLAAGTELRFIRNQSNDGYHDYSIQQGAITLDVTF